MEEGISSSFHGQDTFTIYGIIECPDCPRVLHFFQRLDRTEPDTAVVVI